MQVNFRLNQKITKRILRASSTGNTITKVQLDWNLDNSDKIFGLYHKGILSTTLGLLTRKDNQYRILIMIPEKNRMAKTFMIEDVESFLENIGCEELAYNDNEQVKTLLEKTNEYMPDGYIVCNSEGLYVYEQRPL